MTMIFWTYISSCFVGKTSLYRLCTGCTGVLKDPPTEKSCMDVKMLSCQNVIKQQTQNNSNTVNNNNTCKITVVE